MATTDPGGRRRGALQGRAGKGSEPQDEGEREQPWRHTSNHVHKRHASPHCSPCPCPRVAEPLSTSDSGGWESTGWGAGWPDQIIFQKLPTLLYGRHPARRPRQQTQGDLRPQNPAPAQSARCPAVLITEDSTPPAGTHPHTGSPS